MIQRIYELAQKYLDYAVHYQQIRQAKEFILSGLALALISNKDIKIDDALSEIGQSLEVAFTNVTGFCLAGLERAMHYHELAITNLGLDRHLSNRVRAYLRAR